MEMELPTFLPIANNIVVSKAGRGQGQEEENYCYDNIACPDVRFGFSPPRAFCDV